MKLCVATKALVFNRFGKVLILRESGAYKDATNVGKWDVLGGRIEAGESLLDALSREVMEEAGIKVSECKVIDVEDKISIIAGEEVQIVRIYYRCVVDGEDGVVLSEDHDLHQWIDVGDYSSYNLIGDVAGVFSRHVK
jgi:8-oxo-dGTP pyrophosphatase MutT (NUDIX family)